MNATELIFAPNTSDKMKQLAQSLPPYDLLKAYREARVHFKTTDIVLATSDAILKAREGFLAMPRSEYIEKALSRMSSQQRAMMPIAQSAHQKMAMPIESPAFWLVYEMDDGTIVGCAIGAVLQSQVAAG